MNRTHSKRWNDPRNAGMAMSGVDERRAMERVIAAERLMGRGGPRARLAVGLALALAGIGPVTAWAQASGDSGLLVNSDGTTTCREYLGTGPATDHDDAALCGIADRATQLNRALFYGRNGAARVDSLTLGGELYVNSGRLGLSDQSGGYNMAVGSQATLDATQGRNSIAIGSAQTTADDGATSRATVAAGNQAVAIGSGARANSDNGIALGTNAFAAGTGSRQGSIAIGNQARADGDGSLALGAQANAGGLLSTAIGHGSVATGTSSISIGGNARGTGSVALGGGSTQGDYAQAFGDGATALKRMAWAQGYSASAKGQYSIALGAYSEAATDYAVALGPYARAGGGGAWDKAGTALGTSANAAAQGTAVGNVASASEKGTAVGNYASAQAFAGTAIGRGATVTGTAEGGIALGTDSKSDAMGAVALGRGASAGGGRGSIAVGENAVATGGNIALGAGSRADGSTLGQEAYLMGGTAQGEVNIGDRRMSGIAAGATDTDAVNVAQLKRAVSSSTSDAVMYDSAVHDRITLGGVSASAPVALTNVKNGEISATSTDAINGSQIYTLDRFFRVNYTNGQPAAMAVGGSSLAIGAGAKSFASNSIAIGSYAETSDSLGGGGNIAVGASAAARGFNSMALGANASTFTDAANATAIGYSAKANSDSAVAIGSSAAVAIGDYAKAGGTRSVALGAGSIADGQKAVAMGDSATASGNLSTALGNASKADGGHAIAVGSGARGGADDALAVGHNARVTGKGGVALGTGAKSDQDDGVAIGRNATSSHAGSVALGEGSVADGGTLTREAYLVGGTARGEVNIGERRLTGLAAGAEDTDAVNVEQLKQVVASSTADAVVYDSAAHDRLTLGGVSASAPVALTNVKKGEVSATSTDAVNGAQLYEATQALEAGKGRYVSINDGGVARGNHDNDGATGEDAIAIGVDASASAKGATALGAGAVASAEGSVALGAGSVADQANTVSVGSAGNERRITHVADGVEDTDAANVGQLKKAGIVDPNGETRDVLTYDSGSNRSKVTLGGGAGGTVITNLAEGRVAIGSRDAVNGGQLAAIRDDLQNQIKNVDNRVTQIENNGTGGGQSPGFDADGSEDQPATAPNGSQGTASGAGAVASGNHSTANGAGAIASGNNSTALGAGSQATAENSVALGANSVADRANTVSVGSEGAPRQITNVAAGTAPTDAVNVAQLHDGLQEVKDWSRLYTDGRFDSLNRDINRVGQRADAGVASAMAMASLPQAYLPGANMAGAAISSFRGEASIAIGVSTISEDGRWVYKLNATGNTRGDVGAGMGVGLQW